ncbi:MAG: hypothetical protein ACW980_22455, partial [Promethearchaeota archaeon]
MRRTIKSTFLLLFVSLSSIAVLPVLKIHALEDNGLSGENPEIVEYIAFYDSSDETVLKAIDLFTYFIKDSSINIDIIAIESAEELISQLKASSADVHLYIFHGSGLGMAVGKDTIISWSNLQLIIEYSNPTYHLFASCYSSILENAGNGKTIKGSSENTDYYVATVAATLNFAKIIANKDPEKVNNLYTNIQNALNILGDEFAYRIIAPKETLQTLHYKSQFKEISNDIFSGLEEIFFDCESEYSPWHIIFETIKGINEDVGNIVEDLFNNNGGSYEAAGDWAGKHKKLEFQIGPLNFSLGFWIGIVEHAYFDDNLDYDVFAEVLQVEIWVEFSHEQQIMVGPLPVEFTVKAEMHLYFEYLLEYWASDAANPSARIDSSYKDKLFVSTDGTANTNKIKQLLGYAKVRGPYGKRIIEAWFGGLMGLIPLSFRIYGDISVGLGGTIGVSLSKLYSKLPDLEIPVEIGGDLWGIFALCDSGVKVTLTFVPYVKVGWTKKIDIVIGEIKLDAWIKFSMPIEGVIRWDQFGIWIERVTLFWPVVEIKIGGEIDCVWPLPDYTLNLIDYTEANAFYVGEDLSGKNHDHPKIANVLNEWTGDSGSAIGPGLDGVLLDFNMPFGTLSIEEGSAKDHEAPLVEFITSNSEGDDVSWADGDYLYEKFGWDFSDSLSQFQISILNPLGGFLKNFIPKEVLGPDSSVALAVIKENTIPISGDDATLKFYTFDAHDDINTDSTVDFVAVAIDSDPLRTSITNALNYLYYSQDVKITLRSDPPDSTIIRANLAFFLLGDAYIKIYDGAGNLVDHLTPSGPFGIFPKYAINYHTPWVEGNSITIHIHLNEFSTALIRLTDSYYGNVWTSDMDSSSPIGFISKDSSGEYANGHGLGPAKGLKGHIARWTVRLNLMSLIQNKYIEPGWHTLYVIARDNSGLVGSNTKIFYIAKPEDTSSPYIYSYGSTLRSVNSAKDYSRAIYYDKTIYWRTNDRGTVSYNFDYGAGYSSYDIRSGINPEIGSRISIFDTKSRVIKTTGSGTSNGYRYWFAKSHQTYRTSDGIRPVNPSTTILTFDWKTSDSYWYLFIWVDTTYGGFYLTYTPTYSGYGISSYYIYHGIPGVSDGSWHSVTLNLAEDLADLYPYARITTIDAFLVRGSAYIDNIVIDGNVIEDCEDGNTDYWQVYDPYPSGAYISNLIDYNKRTLLKTQVVNHYYSYSNRYYYYNYRFDVSALLGSYINRDLQVEMTATDNKGIQEKQTYWLLVYKKVDATITPITPRAGYTVSGRRYLKIRALDANGLSSVHYKVDSGSWRTMSYSYGYYVAYWYTNGYSNGGHTIYYRTTDKYGGQKTIAVPVTVYNAP